MKMRLIIAAAIMATVGIAGCQQETKEPEVSSPTVVPLTPAQLQAVEQKINDINAAKTFAEVKIAYNVYGLNFNPEMSRQVKKAYDTRFMAELKKSKTRTEVEALRIYTKGDATKILDINQRISGLSTK